MVKKTDSKKLDEVMSTLADMTEDFGTRFDKLDDELTAVKSKLDGINRRLDSEAMLRTDQKIPARVAAIEHHLGIDRKIAG
jgi:transcriptional regulator of acetoin/glycerol metabolism